MANRTQIQNSALSRLGALRINSENDESEQARQVLASYDFVIKDLLAQATWNFALREQNLQKVVGSGSLFGYANVFQLPVDVGKIVRIKDDPVYQSINGKIHTDSEECVLRYVSNAAPEASWSGPFTRLAITKLASELSYTLTSSDSLRQSLNTDAERLLARAIALDLCSDSPFNISYPHQKLKSARAIK